MKKMFWLISLAVAFLVPFKVDAADLKLTYDNDFKKDPFTSYLALPSYDDNGNVDGQFFFFIDYVDDYSSTAKGLGIFKLGLNNKSTLFTFGKETE